MSIELESKWLEQSSAYPPFHEDEEFYLASQVRKKWKEMEDKNGKYRMMLRELGVDPDSL